MMFGISGSVRGFAGGDRNRKGDGEMRFLRRFRRRKYGDKEDSQHLDSEELELFDKELWRQYHYLLLEQMEHDRKVRRKAIRLSRKHRKPGWVI